MDKHIRFRVFLFILGSMVIGLLMYFPLKTLLGSPSREMYYDYYSYILLVPLVSAYLIFIQRKEIFGGVGSSVIAGTFLLVVGIIGYGAALSQGKSLELVDRVAWQIASLLVAWLAAFLLVFGKPSFKAALFPLSFLFFMAPVPTAAMGVFIYALQKGSAWSTVLIFNLLGTSYFQEGFVFQMGKVTIEVAKECSGIRSTMALVITGVLAAYLFLRRPWSRLLLMLTILPITVFKNGLRIVILTLLAIHVDERFLTGGFLHKSGGFLFYIPGLVIFGSVLLLLRKFEQKKTKS